MYPKKNPKKNHKLQIKHFLDFKLSMPNKYLVVCLEKFEKKIKIHQDNFVFGLSIRPQGHCALDQINHNLYKLRIFSNLCVVIIL